jgi:hypothetical protein
MKNELINKIYDYIAEVSITQGKLLPENLLYGDGSRWNYDDKLFHLVYSEIKNYLNQKPCK